MKFIPQNVPPLVSLVVTYVTALSVSLVALPFAPGGAAVLRSWRQLNWATYAVGVSIVVVELAFLLAYRAGWRLSVASAVSNVATALLLVGVGTSPRSWSWRRVTAS